MPTQVCTGGIDYKKIKGLPIAVTYYYLLHLVMTTLEYVLEMDFLGPVKIDIKSKLMRK